MVAEMVREMTRKRGKKRKSLIPKKTNLVPTNLPIDLWPHGYVDYLTIERKLVKQHGIRNGSSITLRVLHHSDLVIFEIP